MFPSAKVAKLPAAVARPGLAGSPALSLQLLPRRPAFVLLAHPALEPGRDSRIAVPAWGAAGGGSLPAPGALSSPVAVRPLASRASDRRLLSPSGPVTGAPLRALGPAAARSSGRRGPPSLARGIGGRALRMRRRRPAPRGAGGWEWQSFFPWRWAELPAHPPSPRRKTRLHLPRDSRGSPITPPA
ncbi:hypothetical protein NN561_020001 [Cricetulus griseus]